MLYRVIGLMSGSSLDGLDIVYAQLHNNAGKWSFEIIAADCYTYSEEWKSRLQTAESLTALDYQLLHTDYGHYLGKEVNRFIQDHNIQYEVSLVASHGHTTFHLPAQKMTGQLGDGAAIAAETRLAVVSDLRVLDVAFGGQGAPIVPIGEKLLLSDYNLFLNIGGIANISFNLTKNSSSKAGYVAFDVCPANRVLNLIANKNGKEYDDGGQMAAAGNINHDLLQKLNELEYYKLPYPKSLANTFGTDVVYPLIETFELSANDKLRTYVEHIIKQLKNAVQQVAGDEQLTQEKANSSSTSGDRGKLLVTGGGAFNTFLINRLSEELHPLNIEVIVPDEKIVQYKEALIIAFIGVLRWRQEYNVLSSVTGAERDSIGGALWMGQEA